MDKSVLKQAEYLTYEQEPKGWIVYAWASGEKSEIATLGTEELVNELYPSATFLPY